MSKTDSTIGAVLLAAGRSERFGSANKLLATIDGEPVIGHTARTLLDAHLDDRVAVTGHEATAVSRVLPDEFDVRYNDRYGEGQHTSVQTGVVAAQEAGWNAVVFSLGDMPFVAPDTIDTLCEAFVDGRGTILVPTFDGTRGNPVLFAASHYEALADASGDEGGRYLVETHPATVRIPVNDPGIQQDIDRPEDLASFET